MGVGMQVENQVVTDKYALYLGDCCEVLPTIPEESIGYCLFSPPFSDLYSYSDSPQDMSNANSYEEFFEHFRFLSETLMKIMMPGRVVSIHCMDLPTHKRDGDQIGLKDFPGDIIRLFVDVGFVYHCPRITIWKDPLIAATRTKAIGLAHKQIVKDSSMCRSGVPDCIVSFRKPGENPVPIVHKYGLKEYHGGKAFPSNLEHLKGFFDNLGDDAQGRNKRSQWIWQRYASPVWDDIRQTRVLPFKEGKEKDDQRHICPLQLDVIERCMQLWSNEDDTFLTPFLGVGSEAYVAVRNGRRAIGVELKPSYFRQAVVNLKSAERSVNSGFDL